MHRNATLVQQQQQRHGRGCGAAPSRTHTQQQQQRRAMLRCAVSSSQQQQQTAASASARTFTHGVTMTAFEGNSFAVKFAQSGARVLVDPWLVGDLTFFEQEWAYVGRKRALGAPGAVDVAAVAAETDLIVLSQYLDDHTHLPTLRALPKDIPVIAQPEAAERIAPLGFKDVRALKPGESLDAVNGRLRVRATAGALVGPPWSQRQNGIILEEVAGAAGVDRPARLYYEPHCDFDEASVAAAGRVDVVVSPVADVLLGGYALVRGDSDLVKLLRLLRPRVLVPLLNAELDQTGSLTAWMSTRGGPGSVAAALKAAGLGDVAVDMPAPPGEAFAIPL